MNIMVAVPTRGSIRRETIERLQEVQFAYPKLDPIIYESNNLSVALCRNKIVRRFMETDKDVLIMVDDDIIPPPNFLSVLESGIHGLKYDIFAIPHVLPTPGNPSELTLSIEPEIDVPLRYGANTCRMVATGCVAIHRRVFEKMGPDPFRVATNPTDVIISDDALFCLDATLRNFVIGAWLDEDGWLCDHITAVNLAPLYESQQLGVPRDFGTIVTP